MKKLARLIGLLGGVAVVVWAMRDRLVSIATPREPKPPTFRVVPPVAPAKVAAEGDDLTRVIGIGPVFAARLREGGIETFRAIAEAGRHRVAEVVGVPPSRVDSWIEQAGSLAD